MKNFFQPNRLTSPERFRYSEMHFRNKLDQVSLNLNWHPYDIC